MSASQLSRRIAFARHIPPGQIAARLRLEIKRGWHQRFPQLIALPDAEMLHQRDHPPLPLFEPRHGMIARTADDWSLKFLNRERRFGTTIDWQQPPPSVEHQLWRMNLHYMEYLEELDAAEAYALMAQWITANPPYRRGYWRDAWNSYTVSLRVVVWMQQIARHGDAPPAIIASLARQLLFLERNLERDIGGNHLIKNIKALSWGSTFFAGAVATRWNRLATRLLRRELGHQILSDGMHYERSPSYHCQVFADLVEIRHALGRDPLDGKLDEALARMATATAALVHPDGFVAEFNDAGLTMAYAPTACLDAYAAVSGRRVLPSEGSFALVEAGYFGFRDGGDYLIVDFGKIGPDDLPAHAHGDIGSVELSLGGRRMIVDPGVERYVAGPERTASRSAASHNVLSLDGTDQADFFGAFRVGRRPNVAVIEHATYADGFTVAGWHDGYAGLPGRLLARRRIQARDGTIEIVDRIDGAIWHQGSVGFLLHPDCAVDVAGRSARVSLGDRELVIEGDAPLKLEEAHWSPDMGQSLATRRITLTLPQGCFESRVVLRCKTASALGIS